MIGNAFVCVLKPWGITFGKDVVTFCGLPAAEYFMMAGSAVNIYESGLVDLEHGATWQCEYCD